MKVKSRHFDSNLDILAEDTFGRLRQASHTRQRCRSKTGRATIQLERKCHSGKTICSLAPHSRSHPCIFAQPTLFGEFQCFPALCLSVWPVVAFEWSWSNFVPSTNLTPTFRTAASSPFQYIRYQWRHGHLVRALSVDSEHSPLTPSWNSPPPSL